MKSVLKSMVAVVGILMAGQAMADEAGFVKWLRTSGGQKILNGAASQENAGHKEALTAVWEKHFGPVETLDYTYMYSRLCGTYDYDAATIQQLQYALNTVASNSSGSCN